MRMGVDFPKINRKILHERHRDKVGVFGFALQKAAYTLDGTVAYTCLTLAERAAIGAEAKAHPAGVVDYLINIRGVDTALYVSESEPGVFEASMRSRIANVAEVAHGFGGGGHKAAAGCTIREKSAGDAVERILGKLVEKIKE